MPRTDRLGITVSLVMLGLALSMLAPLPSHDYAFVVLGSELTLHFSGPAQFGLILIALVCAGVDAIIRTHPQASFRSVAYTITFWVLPGLLTITGLVLLQDLSWWGYRLGLILITGALLSLVVIFQYRSLDRTSPYRRVARLTLNSVVYIAALVLFVALYGTRMRSLISATAVFVASSTLTLELLRDSQAGARRIWLYAGVTGLLMAELMWVLNYLGLSTQGGGALLLLAFYTMTGLTQQYLWGRLTHRVVLEYGAVCALGAIVLLNFVR